MNVKILKYLKDTNKMNQILEIVPKVTLGFKFGFIFYNYV